MKFKIDENLPLELAEVLQSEGYDAVTAVEEALSGVMDPDVLTVCRSEARAIVTLDIDFADIRLYSPEATAGIIVS